MGIFLLSGKISYCDNQSGNPLPKLDSLFSDLCTDILPREKEKWRATSWISTDTKNLLDAWFDLQQSPAPDQTTITSQLLLRLMGYGMVTHTHIELYPIHRKGVDTPQGVYGAPYL